MAPLALTLFVAGCGSSALSATAPAAKGATDITDAILTARSANCADYVKNYTATAKDVQNNALFKANLQVSNDASSCSFASNAIPNHNFNASGHFAHVVTAQRQSYRIPAHPTRATTPTPLSLQYDNAIMLNGIKIDLLAAGCFGVGDGHIGCDNMATPYRYNPGGSNNFGLDEDDEHNAHTQPDGTYHYHGDPKALFSETDNSKPSPVIGFAAAGFPIFGSYFADGTTIRKAKSSCQLKSGARSGGAGGTYDGTFIDDYQYVAGSGDLDACNGMTVNGVYGYFITQNYPYVMACFSGTPDPSFRKKGPPPMEGGPGGGPPR